MAGDVTMDAQTKPRTEVPTIIDGLELIRRALRPAEPVAAQRCALCERQPHGVLVIGAQALGDERENQCQTRSALACRQEWRSLSVPVHCCCPEN